MPEISVLDCRFELCEPTFFASREIDRLYLTEAVVGNYALAFALGMANSPYQVTYHRPKYAEDLAAAVRDGVYVTPAHPITSHRFRVERFNVQTETYWSTYSNSSILFDPAEAQKTKPKPYANNRPQQGMLKMLARGMKFRFFVFGAEQEQIPAYARIGKFLSKIRIEVQARRASLMPNERQTLTGFYNPLDLPESGQIERCNVVNIHPVPVLQEVRYRGDLYRLDDGSVVPAGMAFRFA